MYCDNNVGNRLKNCRASLGLSQIQLAELAGVASAQLYRYEAGRSKPRPEIVGRLAKALNVMPDWLSHGALPVTQPDANSIAPPITKGLKVVSIDLDDETFDRITQIALENEKTPEMVISEFVRSELTKVVQDKMILIKRLGSDQESKHQSKGTSRSKNARKKL